MPSTSLAARTYCTLLGAASLGSFSLLAQDSSFAPSIAQRITLAHIASGELGEIDYATALIRSQGGDPASEIQSIWPILADYLTRARPGDWYERIIRSYVGFNLLKDLLLELAQGLPSPMSDDVTEVAGVCGHESFVMNELADPIASDPVLASRLGLWGRRVVGEALSLTKLLFNQKPELRELLPGDGSAAEREAELFGRLQQSHTQRLTQLGLNA